LSQQINKQKYAKKINLLCAGANVFVTYQTKEEGVNANPLAYALDLVVCN